MIERRERYGSSAWGPAYAVAQRNPSVRSTTNFTFLRGWAKIASSICRKLAAVASLFDHLCEANPVSHNPVRGVKRPKAEGNEGKTPALSRRPGPGVGLRRQRVRISEF